MSGDLILITGVSGYIGFKTLILALEAGFKVRAVIRKSEQAKKLESHKRVAPFINNLQFCIIPDLSDTESFDPHLQGVTGLLHLASPLANETDDFDRDIISPAIKVTLAVLNAAHRTSSIKRVVITSSAVTLVPFAFMFGPAPPTPDLTLFTAADINTKFATPYSSAMEAYFASKTLSRTATKEFMEREKPSFEFVNLLPTLVFGPDELATKSQDLMTNSCGVVLGSLMDAQIPEMIGAGVHVDDVARAHIDGLKQSVPGNKDYILSSDAPEGICWEDAKEVVKRNFSEAVEKGVLKLKGSMPTRPWRLETRDTEDAFGWKHISLEETVKALVGQYLGFVEAEKK
ncbi:putative 3-beta hydroxysteroid dehydrogenase/isomerase [Stipitochalara longipes BDJ]|nr:putative 3-beta hydroxysteroid dehydrogenase/isomerase [Stipitochalara longipes BDJ]